MVILTTAIVLLAVFTLSGATGEINERENDIDLSLPLLETNETDHLTFGHMEEGQGFSTCPPGWESYRSRCFKFIAATKTWIEAEQYCGHFGGNLASVHSSDDNYFLQQIILKNTNDFTRTWIGGSDGIQESTWLWSDGSRFDYRNWNYGEPNNHSGHEDCLEMNYGGEKRWNDAHCNTKFSFICAIRKC